MLLIYLSLFSCCFILLQVEQYKFDRVYEEKCRVEECLRQAVRKSAECLSNGLYETEEEKQYILETTFFETFYYFMGFTEEAKKWKR